MRGWKARGWREIKAWRERRDCQEQMLAWMREGQSMIFGRLAGELGEPSESLFEPKRWKAARANFGTRDQKGRTMAHWCAIGGWTRQLEALIESEAPLDREDEAGMTPLIRAAVAAEEEIVERLLRAGVRVGAMDRMGESALSKAAVAGSRKVMELLLAAGADPERKNKAGRDFWEQAMEAARVRGDEPMMAWAKRASQASQEREALGKAAGRGRAISSKRNRAL